MMAVMFVASATAFAGDSDALKALKKSMKAQESYSDAETLVKNSLDQLASDQEKAFAYNLLVDIAYKQFNKQDEIRLSNQVMQKNDPIDKETMVKSAINALDAALECDKYDNPQKPKFRKSNQERLQAARFCLLTQGFEYTEAQNNQAVFDCLNPYILTASAPLFKDTEAVLKDTNMGAAAFYCGRSALQLDNAVRAAELFKIGVQDTAKQVHDLCFDMLIYTMGLNRKTAADSTKYLNELKDLYTQYPENNQVYASLSDAMLATGSTEEVLSLANSHLAKYPDAIFPHVYKAFISQQAKKYDEAIAEWNLVPESAPNYVNYVYNRAVCKLFKANEFNDANADNMGRLSPDKEAKYKEMLNESLVDFEKTKELDPDQMTVKWGYLLKNVYSATGQQEKADAIM